MSKTTSKKQGRKSTTNKKAAKSTTSAAKTTRAKTASKKVAAKKTAPKKTASKTVATIAVQAKSTPATGLNIWNKTLAILYLVQGFALIAFAKAQHVSITTMFAAKDPLVSNGGETVFAGATKALFDVNLLYLVALFLFVAATVRIAAATFYRENYEANLKANANGVRWTEVGLVGGLVVFAASLLVGVTDVATLISMFAIVQIASLAGLLLESAATTTTAQKIVTAKLAMLPGAIVGWAVLASYLWGGAQLPQYLYWLVGSLFVLFVLFIVNVYMNITQKGRFADYAYSEKAYLVLSFVAVTATAVQIYLGALRG